MRKRIEAEDKKPEPRLCEHPLITWKGETTYACLFGEAIPFDLDAIGTPEGDAIEAAHSEHFEFRQPGFQYVEHEDLLWPGPRAHFPWLTPGECPCCDESRISRPE